MERKHLIQMCVFKMPQKDKPEDKSRLITYSDIDIRNIAAVTANLTFLYGKLTTMAFDNEGMRDVAEELLVDAIPLYRQYMPKDIHNCLPNLNVDYIEKFAQRIFDED